MVKCDNPNCKKEYEISYNAYNKRNHNGKYYCNKCANSIFNSGENNHFCILLLIDEERELQRSYPKYIEFIKRVMVRDNYTCQCCKKELNHDGIVHHLDGYDWCKEKRTDESNGITLCTNCHKNFHSIYGFGNNTKEQFYECIWNAIGELEKYNGELPTARKIYCVEENKIYDNALELAKEWNVHFATLYKVC